MSKHFDIIPPEPEDIVDLGTDFMFSAKDLEQVILALNWYKDTWTSLTRPNRARVEDILDKYTFVYQAMTDDQDFMSRWESSWK